MSVRERLASVKERARLRTHWLSIVFLLGVAVGALSGGWIAYTFIPRPITYEFHNGNVFAHDHRTDTLYVWSRSARSWNFYPVPQFYKPWEHLPDASKPDVFDQ